MQIFVETDRAVGIETCNGHPLANMFVASPEHDDVLCTLSFDGRLDRPSKAIVSLRPRVMLELGHALIAVARYELEREERAGEIGGVA